MGNILDYTPTPWNIRCIPVYPPKSHTLSRTSLVQSIIIDIYLLKRSKYSNLARFFQARFIHVKKGHFTSNFLSSHREILTIPDWTLICSTTGWLQEPPRTSKNALPQKPVNQVTSIRDPFDPPDHQPTNHFEGSRFHSPSLKEVTSKDLPGVFCIFCFAFEVKERKVLWTFSLGGGFLCKSQSIAGWGSGTKIQTIVQQWSLAGRDLHSPNN